jgi:hypothetical protein
MKNIKLLVTLSFWLFYFTANSQEIKISNVKITYDDNFDSTITFSATNNSEKDITNVVFAILCGVKEAHFMNDFAHETVQKNFKGNLLAKKANTISLFIETPVIGSNKTVIKNISVVKIRYVDGTISIL